MGEKRFPILKDKRGMSIPWEVAERFRNQAMKNHSQTLERLAERGGLSWEEVARAACGLPLFSEEIER